MQHDGNPSPVAGELGAERLSLALEAGRMGTWLWDVASGRLEWDEPMERVFGLEPGTFGGTFEHYLALLHPEDRDGVVAVIEGSLAAKGDHYVEHRVLLPRGGIRWVSGQGRGLLDDVGDVRGMVGVGTDITARKRAELRLGFLARAGILLGSSLDVEATLEQLSQLAIEDLADWCSIDLVEPSGVRLVTVTHRDASKVAYARRLRERLGVDLDAPQGLGAVLRTGLPDVLPEIDESLVRTALAAYPDLSVGDVEEFLELGLRASMTVPLVSSKGIVLGAITLVSAESGRGYDEEDLGLAVELAGRAATAVDNAQLYARAEHAARTLQRSLLPPVLPEVPFADVAAFYAPARSDELIGGDFYDLFPLADDCWGLLVGDVSGKGVDAAALTAASRWTLRAALSRSASPGAAIAELNEALLGVGGDRFVTVLAAVLCKRGEAVEVSYASGGHPAPVVRRGDGTAGLLPVEGQIVGLLEGAEATTYSAVLEPGEVLAIFSDGFTEARSGDELFGDSGMVTALQQWPGGTAQEAVDALCASVAAFGVQRDDMALVVVAVPAQGPS